MAVNYKEATPLHPSETNGITFGGMEPELPPTEQGQFSLQEPAPAGPSNVGETFSLNGVDTAFPPKSGPIADQKIAKVQFAFGEDAPKPEVMANQLATGREDQIREQLARSEDAKDLDTKIAVVKELTKGGVPKDPATAQAVENIIKHKPSNDPRIILEQAFARAYTNMVPQIGGAETNVVNEGMKKNPDHTNMVMDVAQELLTKQEIAKTAKENISSLADNQSTSESIHDTVNRFMPFYDWYVTYNAVNGNYTKQVLQGNNWAQQIDYLYSLPPLEMHQKLTEALANIREYNVKTAEDFAEAVVSFGSSDQFVHNVGSVIDVASVIPVGTTLKILNRGVSAVAKGGVVRGTEEVTTQALKDAVKANANETTSIADTLAKMGDTKNSAIINASKRLDENLAVVDNPLVREDIRRKLPSIFNPESIITDGANLSTLETEKIVQRMETNATKIIDRLSNLGNVVRLPEEARLKAIEELSNRLESEMSHISNSIIDIKYVPPELHPTMPNNNVSSVSAWFGNREGRPFANQMQAYDFGRSMLKLHPEDIAVEQKGTGFYLKINRNLDETLPSVRNVLTIDTHNQTPVNIPNLLFGWLRSANDRVSQHQIEQRIAAVSGNSAITEAMKPLARDIGALSKNEHKRVGRVIEANRSYVNPEDGTLGRFHHTVADYEREFKELNGSYPSNKEVQAYFSAKQINDIDYIMRNAALYKDRARQGIREVILSDFNVDKAGNKSYYDSKPFLGKEIDKLPLDQSQHGANVLIHNDRGESKVYRLWDLQNGPERKYIDAAMEAGFKVIQTHNPARELLDGKYSTDPINFIVSKDVRTKNLSSTQLPYREGFHKEYSQSYYVKQPIIKEGVVKDAAGNPTVTHHNFVDDNVVFAFNTKPEAEKYAKAMDTARQILNGEINGNLKEYLEKNLPFSEKKFRSLFESTIKDGKEIPAIYKPDRPFLHTFDRQTTMDAHGPALKESFKDLEDQVRSPWNLMANEDKKFIGQKDADLWTVKEANTEGNPTYQLTSAKMVDAWTTINGGMANVMRNRFMADYKTQAVESFVSQFGHLIEGSTTDLLNNAMYHVFQPTWKRTTVDNISEMAAAKNARRAIMELIGNETPVRTAVGSIKQKLVDLVYDKAGQRVSDVVADHLLASELDPLKAMRGFAFHTTIGMFNPLQLWQNLNTMSFAVSLGGEKGLYGSAVSPLMRYAMVNSNPKVMAELGNIAEKVSLGKFKSEWFQESFKEMQKTGRMFVEGEHAWKDDIADPKFVQGMWGDFLDKGQVFFREGERATRLAGWNTAYLEWRMANPNEKITDAIRNKILARSDDMNANMTRASAASWQQGFLSVPTQFMSYPIRITEMMLRKSIPMEDKARTLFVQSALYGLPIGLTGTTLGGFYDFYKDIRQEGLRRNIDMSDPVIDSFHSGIMGMMAHMITDRPNSMGDKAGPGGNSMLRDLLTNEDKHFIDFAFGASGSKVGAALTSLKPALASLVSYTTGQEQKAPLTLNDFVDVARNISSVDNAAKTYLALTTGKLVSKNGTYQGNENPMEAMIAAFTGGQPRAISDVELMKNWEKSRENLLKTVEKDATKWHTMALQAKVNNDEPNYNVYMSRMNTLLEASDLRPDERAGIVKKVWESNQSMAEKIPMEFFIKKAPPSQAPGASEIYKNYKPNPPIAR